MDSAHTQNTFLESFSAYNDAIFRYCYFQTSNREIALDLTQDTFMRAWEYLQTGKTVGNMRAFLYRIATNLIIDYRRKRKATSLDTMIESGYDTSTTGRKEVESIIEGQEILKLVDQIDEKYRDVIIMRYIDDMSIKEIALAMGELENTISVRIHRGLEKLKKLYITE